MNDCGIRPIRGLYRDVGLVQSNGFVVGAGENVDDSTNRDGINGTLDGVVSGTRMPAIA